MASMNDKDYYAILEVEKDASTEEIRKAFQTKARKLHPDVNKAPDAEERFKEVSEAYAVLSDPDKRKRYDAMRSGNPFAGAGAGYGTPNDVWYRETSELPPEEMVAELRAQGVAGIYLNLDGYAVEEQQQTLEDLLAAAGCDRNDVIEHESGMIYYIPLE